MTVAALSLILAAGSTTGCSIKKLAINKLGNALAEGGTTYAADDDPELVRQAVPFSLKLMESLLAESPKHQGLLLATASGFTQYAYAFVQQDADVVEDQDFRAAEAMRLRCRRLYLRARDYGLRGLEIRHPGFAGLVRKQPQAAAQMATRKDVPLLYWTTMAWGAAIAVSKDDPELVGDMGVVEALIDRALVLHEAFDRGAIHTFLITYEMIRPAGAGQPEERARKHFARAMELSEGKLVSPLVSLAESVSVAKQDRAEFESLLRRALSIDPGALPEARLVNLVLQRRAQWLLSRTAELFFEEKK
jgi:predicted anti-sigma-YlaC factor YlaD